VKHGSVSSQVVVRYFSAGDLAAVGRISQGAGQPEPDSGADPDYVAVLLKTGTVAVAETGSGVVVGWGAVKPTARGSHLTDLFVDSQWHGVGVGAALIRFLWPDAPMGPGRFTFSSRHAHAIPLYARLGLVPSWPLLYLTGDPRHLAEGAVTAKRVSAADAARAEAVITGFDRASDHAFWARRDGATGLLLQDHTGLVAAGAGTPAELTHLVCVTDCDATATVLAALRVLGSDEIAICLPGPHPALLPLLQGGLRITDQDVHMATPDVLLPTTWVYSPGLA